MYPIYSLGILFFFDYTDGIHKHDMYDFYEYYFPTNAKAIINLTMRSHDDITSTIKTNYAESRQQNQLPTAA